MTERKGIELPDREGRWEEMSVATIAEPGDPYPHMTLVGDWPGTKNLAVYRRMPDEKPMPELRVGDGVGVSSDPLRVAVVTRIPPHGHPCIAFTDGRRDQVKSDRILAVYRDGVCIWKRDQS